MRETYYIESANLESFLSRLHRDFSVFVPVKDEEAPSREQDYRYRKYNPSREFEFNPYRVVEPLKSFFTPPLEKVAEYFRAEKEIPQLERRAVIVGLKSCDLAAHRIQDFVFLEGVEVDALYRVRRENLVLVSSDCTSFKEVCFCLAMDVVPHPTQGFDLNLSPIADGYLVEVGSAKGERLIEPYREYFAPAKDAQLAAREKKRTQLIERLKRHLLPQDIPAVASLQPMMKEGYLAETWQQFMLTCVECGGCNLICDTCHCFLLSDRQGEGRFRKARLWDSCLYANYARVAGGANPLKTRAQRLRNRFMKKFDFFIEQLGFPACCGCGRCIEVCPGKIDIREVLKDVAKRVRGHQKAQA